MASDSWINANDNLARAIGNAESPGAAGFHYEAGHMTIDQQLKVAEICALLAIAEELSSIAHTGIGQDAVDHDPPHRSTSY